MSKIEISTFVPETVKNEYTDTVALLAAKDAEFVAAGAADRASAVITVPTADVAKHATRFAKAANAAGHGARKRAVTDNGDDTTSLTFTLGKMRTSKPAAEVIENELPEVAVEGEAEVAPEAEAVPEVKPRFGRNR